jgi:tetratricopeptide (TPR) repeat protein
MLATSQFILVARSAMETRTSLVCVLALVCGCQLLPKQFAPVAVRAAPADDAELLKKAAASLDASDPQSAATYLREYLHQHPTHAAIRLHLAEVLEQLGQKAEATTAFEEYIADAQQQGPPADRHLVRAHTRLVELATASGNTYAYHLHRGIGLLVLAGETEQDAVTDATTQRLVCRSIRELEMARKIRPDDARPHWYLHLAWSRLGQSQPALTHLARARDSAPFSNLTSAEFSALAATKK